MRKIIQISTSVSISTTSIGDEVDMCNTFALCDDGSLWSLTYSYDQVNKIAIPNWESLPDIPQDQRNDKQST